MSIRVYNVTVLDRGGGARYDSHVVVDYGNDGSLATDWGALYQDLQGAYGLSDEAIHYYFTAGEWADNLQDGTIETEEFTYYVLDEVAPLTQPTS